jgi:hypothetical protein
VKEKNQHGISPAISPPQLPVPPQPPILLGTLKIIKNRIKNTK